MFLFMYLLHIRTVRPWQTSFLTELCLICGSAKRKIYFQNLKIVLLRGICTFSTIYESYYFGDRTKWICTKRGSPVHTFGVHSLVYMLLVYMLLVYILLVYILFDDFFWRFFWWNFLTNCFDEIFDEFFEELFDQIFYEFFDEFIDDLFFDKFFWGKFEKS